MSSAACDSDCSVGLDFNRFLEESEKRAIRLDGCDVALGIWVTMFISGLHRWKPEYCKRVFAKVMSLIAWFDGNHSPVTLVTFTTRHDLPKPDQIDLLRTSFGKAKDLMRLRVGYFPYFWVIEPHDDGYAHIHMLVFKSIPREVKRDVKHFWEDIYKAGGRGRNGNRYKDAVHFKTMNGQRDLREAVTYMCVYLTKTTDSKALADINSGYFKMSSWLWKMGRRDTDYKGVRAWGCSDDIREAMRCPYEGASEVTWWRTSWRASEWEDWFPLWIDDDMAAYPERIYEFDRLLALGEVTDYTRTRGTGGYG